MEKLIVIQKKYATDTSGLLKVKLQQLKGDYKKWKQSLIYLLIKRNILTVLSNDEPLQISEKETALEEIRKTIDEAKAGLKEVITTLGELAQQADTAYQQYQTRFEQLKEEEQYYGKLVERKAALTNTLQEKQNELSEITVKLESMNQKRIQIEKELIDSQKDNEKLKETCSALQEELEQKMKHLQDSEYKRLKDFHELLKVMAGVKKVQFDGLKLHVWLAAPEANDSGDLLVTVTYVKDDKDKIRICEATVDNPTLDLSDIIKSAIYRDDVPYLISEIKLRWSNHFPLYKEVELLRHKYALDWLPDERVVKVLYGDNGHIICTLHVANEYPSEGSITVKSIEGTNFKPDFEQMHLKTVPHQLTDWLHFLENCFGVE